MKRCQRKNAQNDNAIIDESMVLSFLEIGHMTDFADVIPGNHNANDQDVNDGNQETENLKSHKSLRFNNVGDV